MKTYHKFYKHCLLFLLVLTSVFLLAACASDIPETSPTPTPVQNSDAQPSPTSAADTDSAAPTATTAPAAPTATTVVATPTPTPVILPDGPFEKDATQVVYDIKIGWNLGNTFDASPANVTGLATETSWGNPKTSKELIDLVKESGFNAVRLPVTWGNHMDENNQIDPAWMERVAEVVGYILDNDMYCVLNVHHDTGTEGWLRASRSNEEAMREKFTALWSQVATHFADYPDKLLFESFNEILTDDNMWSAPPVEAVKVTNELNQLFVDTVRSSGGNNDKRCLIVNTYAASTDNIALSYFELPKDSIENRLILEAHIYSPFQFTHEDYPTEISYTETSVKTPITTLFVKIAYSGIPVIIGEFGCADKDNDVERASWAKYFVDTAASYGIKCFWWDNGSQYAVINRKRNVVSEPFIVEAIVTEANGGDYVIDEDKILNYGISANLCSNLNKWGNWIDAANGAKATMSYTKAGITMTVAASGKNEWDAQPSYNTITVEQGVTYKLSFDYSGTIAQTMTFTLQQNYGDYVSYFSDSIDLEPAVKHYETTFTMTEPTDNNAKIAFNFGASQYTDYTNTIENLTLIAVE